MPPPTQSVTRPSRDVAPGHFVEERRREARAGAAERVAERDGAAVDVQAIGIDVEFAEAGQDLHGEGLVQFDEIDVLERQAEAGQQFPDRRDTGPTPNRSGATPAVA